MTRLMMTCAAIAAASLAILATCAVFVAVHLSATQVVVDTAQAAAMVGKKYPGDAVTCPSLAGTVRAGTKFTCAAAEPIGTKYVIVVVNSDGTYDIKGEASG